MDQICGGVIRNASGVTVGWKVEPDDEESDTSSIEVQRDAVVAIVLKVMAPDSSSIEGQSNVGDDKTKRKIGPSKCEGLIKSLFPLESDKKNKTTKSPVEEVDGKNVVKGCNGKPLWDACEEYFKGKPNEFKDILIQSVGGAAGSFDEQHMYRRILYFYIVV